MHSRYDFAVVAGKFEPFHEGHRALIEHAGKIATGKVYILLVCKENDVYDPHVRALSIYETFPNLNIQIKIVDDIYTDDDSPESHILWARYTEQILGFKPQVVVASEDYGRGWAEAMGCDFVMFDQARLNIPVSGTLVRKNAFKQSKHLPMATKRYTLPRVVVMGAESTGTTTLTKALAEHYDTVWVPELGRALAEESIAAGGTNDDNEWTIDRFWLTSRGQDAHEERLARFANGLLMCDTDSLATYGWYTYYTKKETPGFSWAGSKPFLAAGLKQARKHCLYIITSPEGVPFEDDGTRTGEALREWHHDMFVGLGKTVEEYDIPYIVVSGTREERLAQAIAKIDEVIGNE